MAISFVAKGAFTGAASALTVTQPADAIAGDLLLLFVHSANEAITTPSGYTQVTNSPQSTGTAAAAGGVRLGVYWKIHSGSESSVSVADTGSTQAAIILAYRGVDESSPFHTTAGSTQAATTSMVFPAVTTTITDTMIVLGCAQDTDAASTATSGTPSNANLTSLTERHDQTVTAGAGGGLVILDGQKASAGSTGTTTSTGSTSVTHAYLTMALRPKVQLSAELSEFDFTLASPNNSQSYGYRAGIASDGSSLVALSNNSTSGSVSTNGGDSWSSFTQIADAGAAVYGSGAGLWVAVHGQGTPSTTASSSTNGTTWTSRTLPASLTWNGVAYDGTSFVAVGATSATGAISTDGTSWSSITLPSSQAWKSVAYGGGIFVAISNTSSASTAAASSPTGSTWTARTLPTSANWQKVAYGNGRFVAIAGGAGTPSTVAAYSTDGTSWNAVVLPVSEAWVDLVFGGGVFVAICANRTYLYSTNGVTWNSGSLSSDAGYTALGYSAKKFAILAATSATARTLTFKTGWSAASGTLTDAVTGPSANAACVATASAALVTDVKLAASVAALCATTGNLRVGALLAANAVCGGAAGGKWTAKTNGTSFNSASKLPPAVLGSRIVAVSGNSANNALRSDNNGDSWSVVTIGTNGEKCGAVASNGARLVASLIGDNDDTASISKFAHSTDGISWTVASDAALSIGYSWTNVAYGNGRFVMMNSVGTLALYSTDGLSWTSTTVSLSGSSPKLFFLNGLFYYCTSGASYYTSSDGISWTSRTGTFEYLAYCSTTGRYIGVVNGSGYKTSTDGVNWDSSTGGPTASAEPLAAGGGVVVSGRFSDPYMSEDGGQTWTALAYGVTNYNKASGLYVGDRLIFLASGANAGSSFFELGGAKAWAALSTQITPNAAIVSVVTLVGALDAGAVQFNASVGAVAACTAALGTSIQLGGDVSAVSTVLAADLTLPIQLTASIAALSSALSAALSTQIQLSAAATAAAVSGADLATAIRAQTSAAGQSSAQGALTTAVKLAAAANVSSTATPDLTAQIRLAAAVAAATSTSAALFTVKRRGGNSSNNGNGSASLNLVIPANTRGGDVMVAVLTAIGGTGTVGLGDPPPGWALLDRTDRDTVLAQVVCWKVASGSPSAVSPEAGTTVTWTFTNNKASGVLDVWYDAKPGAPYFVASQTNASSTSVTAPGGTTAFDFSMAVWAFGTATNTTQLSVPGTFSQQDASSGNPATTTIASYLNQPGTGVSVASQSATVGAAAENIGHLYFLQTENPLIGAQGAAQTTVSAALQTQVQLNAAIAASSTAGADLTAPQSAALASSVQCLASTTADLTTAIRPAAAIDVVSTATADLTTAIRPAAAAAAQSTATAALTAQIALAASGAAVGAVGASLTVGSGLFADAACITSTTAALATAIQLAASTTATCTTTASLTAGSGLFADVACAATTTAALTTAVQCAASGAALTTATSALTTSIDLAAAISCTAATVGALTAAIQLAASAAAVVTASATADQNAAQLAASVACSSAATAALTTAIRLNGDLNTAGTAAGALTTQIRLTASAAAACGAAGALTTDFLLASALGAAASTTGALSTGVALAAASGAEASAAGALTTQPLLAAVAQCQASASATLGEWLRLVGAARDVAIVPADVGIMLVPTELGMAVAVEAAMTVPLDDLPSIVPT